jgi:hypothetical protein
MSFTDLIDSYCNWYNTNIKERRHDRLDIGMMFKNSRLAKNVVKHINGSFHIKGCRALGPGEDKDDDEKYLIRATRGARVDNIVNEPATAAEALREMYEEYKQLAELNGVDSARLFTQ